MSTLRLCNVDPSTLALETCKTVIASMRTLSGLIGLPIMLSFDESLLVLSPLFKLVRDLTVYAKAGESESEETIPQRIGKLDALYLGPLGYPLAPPPDTELELVIAAAQARWLLHTGHRITTAQLAILVSLDRMRIQQMISAGEIRAIQERTGRRGWSVTVYSACKLIAERSEAAR